MSEFLERLNEEVKIHPGVDCTVGEALRTMPPDEAAAVQQALDDPSIKSAPIMRSLRAMGYGVGGSAVGKHRRGDCACRHRRPVDLSR